MLKAGFVLDGKYRILSVIGQGGMSTVYLAVHERLKQKWAVKEISMEYCENYEMISRKLIVEADILKRLDHPGLPKIVDIIEKKDAIWMVMEFIEGKTLKEILNERGRIEEKEILIWGKQLCEVLSYLHSKKPSIIYRDLKPENIILKKTGRLVLIDFGTAREYCYKNTACDAMYLGTKGYAAPEQYGGMGQTDARTDIYCLGVTLYSLLTGYNPEKPPYKIYPEKYWGEHISLEMKSLLLKCIQSEPEKRYQNCRELAYALSQIDYKKQKEKENERRKIIKFLIFMMVGQLSLMFCIGCKKVSFCYKEEAVVRYINAAEKSEDKKEASQYYKLALELIPEEKLIYQSMVKYFIRLNHFQIEDAVILLDLINSVCEEGAVIEVFQKHNALGYAEFSYALGLGYFYDMGNITGKGASEKWFCEAIDTMTSQDENEAFGKQKRKRAGLYNIDEECYYNTSVKGMIDIREKYLDLDSIHIQAMPLDDRAREAVKENEAESNDGMLDILAWTHTKKGNLHQISFDFAVEGKWKFILDCADLAGNKGVSNQTGEEGIESTDVTIDKSAPELSVDYKGIINVMEAESSPANINKKLKSNGEKITSSGNELFMKRENSIDICIEDMNLEAENIELKLYRVKYGLNGKIEQNKESWEEITEKIKQEPEKQELEKGEQEKNSKTVMRYSVTNLDDGHYKLMIHCTDKAGNVMTAEKSSETERCIYNGYYESPLYTVDTKSPLITSVILNQNAVKKIGKRQYFQNAPQITIKIQEENFNKINFSLEGKMFYSNGMVMEKEWERFKSQEKSLQWKSYYEDGIRINETNIQVEAEGNYTLNFGVIDSAACVANQENLKITYDCHKPEIIYTGVDNESGDLIFKAEENGDDKKKNTLLLFHKYHFFRYFSKRRMNVFIRIKDAISGIERINYAFIPYEEQTIDINKFSQVERTGAEKINDEYFEKKDLSEFSITVSPEKENFKGYLKVYGQDYSGNVSEMVKSKGAISESLQLHKETSNITMKMPRAFFTDKEKNIRYYNSTVPVQAIFEDTYAGIYKTQLYAKTTKKKDSSIKTGKTIMWDGDNLIYRKRQQIELEADKFSQSDADNPLTIQADLEDNAGHTEKNILNEKVVIDNTKPEIEVVYNQNNQTQYYNFSRKATVTVKEKNFSPDLVVWNIQGSNQKYQIGEWKNVQGTYVCEISFEEDGRDYSVGLSVTDKAGNKSEWKDRNYFTIDKTVPQISIQINGIGKQADQVPYFNTERIITFCIQEQNFDKDKVEYNIDAIHGKSRITIKKPVKYQEDGDKYYSRLVLRKEAKYQIQVKCTDKAGNVSETAETKEFIIDTTTPAVHIAGVKQNGIYQGKKIMPQVICKDQYLDRESVEISLKKIDDRNVLKKEWSYERAESENTVQVQWDNIKKTENSDGIYYLQIKGQDKAGNKIKDDFKVVFCVNQRGADFILSHALKKKINKYYLKEAPKIKLREQCVKQTKSRAVILKDNEERKVIGESSITSSVIADKKSERYGWYEKYYNFAKKDFEREGDYRVTFQADTKEKELRFVVDKTPPVVHIGNLDKQIYEEKEHEFTIRVMDNYAFKELELYMETDRNILGQKGTKKIIIKPKDLDENYMVRKTLTADKRYQTVRYIARDKAGNVIDSNDNGDTKVCLVTDSKTVKEYQEHKKEYMLIGIISTLGIFIVISGSGLFIFTRRKRNLK